MSEIGNVYGRLTVTEFVGLDKRNKRIWLTNCSCGTQNKQVLENNLRTGHTLSCGCLCKERTSKARKTHGLTRSPEYKIWVGIQTRCYNPNSQSYIDYGGRGIFMCESWKIFENFLADMGKRPSPNHSIERIDNEKHYSPDNCRWATKKEQSGNKRNSIMIFYNGKTQCLAHWCQELKIKETYVRARVRAGANPIEALQKAVEKFHFQTTMPEKY